MKTVRIQDYKDFGLVMTEIGIDGYIVNNDEVLSGIGPNFNNYTGGRFVLVRSEPSTVKMGPFLDDTDGKTAEDGLTIAQADVKLSKNDGAFASKNEASSAAADAGAPGWYDVILNGNDINTQGNLLVFIHVAGALPVWRLFEVNASEPS